MKELQTKQETQHPKIECKYEKDEREYCDHGVLGNVYVRSFACSDVYGEFGDEDLAKIIDNLPALEYAILIEEPCDCGDVRHNDGGNYHSRIRVYEITPCVYLAVYGDTREAFNVEEFKYIIVWVEDEPLGLVVAKIHDCCHLLKREELEEFVKGYEEDGYSIYYCET